MFYQFFLKTLTMILPVIVAVADVESDDDDDIDERDGEVDRLLRRAEGRKFSIWRRGAHSLMAHSDTAGLTRGRRLLLR